MIFEKSTDLAQLLMYEKNIAPCVGPTYYQQGNLLFWQFVLPCSDVSGHLVYNIIMFIKI